MADDSAATTGATMPPASVVGTLPAGTPGIPVSGAHLVSPQNQPHGVAAVPGGIPVSSMQMQAPYPGIAPTMMMQPPPGSAIPVPGARVAQIQHHQSQAELNTKLQNFWHEQMEEVQLAHDFKNHLLPLARIKKIMKSDEDVRMISAEAPVLFAKACEMFILELTHRAWAQTEEAKRRTLQRSDISTAIQKTDIFDFLIDIVPRDDPKKEHGVGVMNPGVGVAMPGVGVPGGGMSGVAVSGMPTAPGVGVAGAIDAQSQMQYYMNSHAPYAGSTDPAAAAAAGMMYAQGNQYASGTTGYTAGMHYNPQYMRVAGSGQQPQPVMYATQQPQYNQQYLAGNTAETPQQPPPSQS